MTCPHCGARNTADAPWCTQCLEPLQTADPRVTGEPPSATPSPSTPAPSTSSPSTPSPSTPGPPAEDTRDRAVRSVDGRVEWRCPACETWNDLEVPACAVCGQRLGASVTGAGPSAITERVGRARRLLWVAAGIGAVLMVVSIVLLVAALRSGTG